MARTLRYLFLLLFICSSGIAFGQAAAGEITGRILDEKKEPIINAVVEAKEGDIVKGGAVTDYDGVYSIKPLGPGRYDVAAKYVGKKVSITTGVVVSPDKTTGLNFQLESESNTIAEVVITAYKVPLIDKYKTGANTTFTSEEIEKMPTRQTNDVASTAAGVYQSGRGGGLSIGGGRGDNTVYIVDGVQVQGGVGVDMSQNSVDQIEVMTSGIPAKYGDATGGIINITTKGVSKRYTGDLLLQHSIDGYNNNLASFSISGPLAKKKNKNGDKVPVMGFALSGDYYDDHDRYPAYFKEYVTKGDVLDALRKNPLTLTTQSNGAQIYQYSAAYITKDQLTQVLVPPNNRTQEIRATPKFDFQLAENLNLTAGGTFDYIKDDGYSRARNLFDPEGTPVTNTVSGRGFIRFTQRFGKAPTSGDAKPSIISNAYYTIQADYQKTYGSSMDAVHKKNIFDYGYVGKINEVRQNYYQPQGVDSLTGKVANQYLGSYVTNLTYDRSELNPILANYTTEYFNHIPNGIAPTNVLDIEAQNALANGDVPSSVYQINSNIGSRTTGFSIRNNDQYGLNVDASFDLQLGKTRHAIEFGLYYQQRVNSFYSLSSVAPSGSPLWRTMRLLISSPTNNKLIIDKENPIFRINGQSYTAAQLNSPNAPAILGVNDTILYNYKNIGTEYFDKALRTKLGYASNEIVNVDAIDPSKLSLNMFSADELINTGKPFVTYYGYNYLGERENGNVNFNDYWTKKDANGNFSRPVGAFRPNYIAGYIQDKFSFKDLLFNVGVRIERFSANTKVLKDPWSLYEERTLGEVTGVANTINGGKHPSNLPNDAVVYVNDNTTATPSIIGYRSGDNFYDPNGKFIEDPSILAKLYNGGSKAQPYLTDGGKVKITDTSFNPNNSFTDYTPAINVMPRIQFQFPISDVALFYAHYDILVQRPTANESNSSHTFASPTDFFYLEDGAVLNNPNLKPEKVFDYEIGFEQKLTDQSAITLTAFYKERKDQINLRNYTYAYPFSYSTYGNRDFSTTKGLTLKYDLRRISHLRMAIAYTLQFAEGTGSAPSSSYGLLSSFIADGLPNLRYVNALDYDSRHIINVSADFRFNDGEGPIVGGKHILQNAGINIIAKARSGEPYTRYAKAIDDLTASTGTVVGAINSSRIPWHYGLDLRIDKDFSLNFGKKNKEGVQGVKAKRPLYLNAFFLINNVLNVQDIAGVYRYTGRADDNGFLASAQGQVKTAQQISPQSYIDMYRIAINSPGAYNLPRTINFGLQFSF